MSDDVACRDIPSLQCVAEGGQGGILRIDFSSDGKWIRAEARASGDKHSTQSGATSMVLSAESGELCEDSKVTCRYTSSSIPKNLHVVLLLGRIACIYPRRFERPLRLGWVMQ